MEIRFFSHKTYHLICSVNYIYYKKKLKLNSLTRQWNSSNPQVQPRTGSIYKLVTRDQYSFP